MTKKYEIQHFTICDGWINAWTVDGKSEYFESYKQAEKYLRKKNGRYALISERL